MSGGADNGEGEPTPQQKGEGLLLILGLIVGLFWLLLMAAWLTSLVVEWTTMPRVYQIGGDR